MLKRINETSSYLKTKINDIPKIGIILGTGLGNLATQITNRQEINYASIPNFPLSTVEGTVEN